MKRKLLSTLLVFCIFFSCKKRIPVEFPAPSEPGTIESLSVNGKSWSRPNMSTVITGLIGRCKGQQNYSISLSNTSVANDTLDELVLIDNIKVGRSGKISLNNVPRGSCDTIPHASLSLVVGRDFGFASYSPDFGKDNYLQIDSYDTQNHVVMGSKLLFNIFL